MKEYYVLTNRDGMISLKEKSTSKRDPPSQESRERKKLLKQEISKNPKFESFLKENKVYGRFVSNFMKRCEGYSSYSFINQTKRIHSSEPINFCLCWADTREGHEFWRELDSKYINS